MSPNSNANISRNEGKRWQRLRKKFQIEQNVLKAVSLLFLIAFVVCLNCIGINFVKVCTVFQSRRHTLHRFLHITLLSVLTHYFVFSSAEKSQNLSWFKLQTVFSPILKMVKLPSLCSANRVINKWKTISIFFFFRRIASSKHMPHNLWSLNIWLKRLEICCRTWRLIFKWGNTKVLDYWKKLANTIQLFSWIPRLPLNLLFQRKLSCRSVEISGRRMDSERAKPHWLLWIFREGLLVV